jgi:hypothetical protein
VQDVAKLRVQLLPTLGAALGFLLICLSVGLPQWFVVSFSSQGNTDDQGVNGPVSDLFGLFADCVSFTPVPSSPIHPSCQGYPTETLDDFWLGAQGFGIATAVMAFFVLFRLAASYRGYVPPKAMIETALAAITCLCGLLAIVLFGEHSTITWREFLRHVVSSQ